MKNAAGGLVAIAILRGLLFGGVTCGIRVIGGEEAYALWLYRNNVQDGDYTTHHDNGEVASIQPYSNGKINGEARYFDEEGRLLRTVTYRNGIQHGPYTLYHPSGEVKEQGRYANGSKM